MSSDSEPPNGDWKWVNTGKPDIPPLDVQPRQPRRTGASAAQNEEEEVPSDTGQDRENNASAGGVDASDSRQTTPASELDTARCVLMGPSKAGKTTLLNSFDQACSSPFDPDDQFRLEYMGGDGTNFLANLARRTVMEEFYSIAPSQEPKIYEASITATEARTFWQPTRQHVAHLAFRDGPGGILFPSDEGLQADVHLAQWEKVLIQESRVAGTLVLCVDAKDPRPDLVSHYMRNILSKIGGFFAPKLDKSPGYRMLEALHLVKPRPTPTNVRRISTRRFLLLLNKIDELAGSFIDWPGGVPQGFEPPTPARLATHLSPVQVACELLDESNLLRIANALQPDAEFAVGLTSAWGFNPHTGRPFMEKDNPVGLSNQSRSRRFLNWRPFGVREALLFMVTGIARHPVQKVDPRMLQSRLHNPIFQVPHAFFPAAS